MQQLEFDKFELHPYQDDAYCQILNALESKLRTLLVMPTGSGKTIVAREVIRRFLNVGNRVLFLSHRRQLNSQLIAKVGQHPRLTVSTIQGFKPGEVAEFDLIVIDEAHHVGAASYKAAIAAYPAALLLGLTATPVRPNGDGLGKYFDVMVQTTTAAKLTEAGYLAPIKAYGPEELIETTGVGKSKGDFNLTQLSKVSAADKHCAHAVEEYKKWALGKRGIVFCVSRAHARKMARFYQAAGFRSLYMDGVTPEMDRVRHLKAWAAGEYDMICNCDLFTEGSDLAGVEFVQILRATLSLPLYFQMIGRGMRPDSSMILLDHTSNFQELGLPDTHPGYALTQAKEGGGPILRDASQRRKVRNESGEIVDGDVLVIDSPSNLAEIDRDSRRERAIAVKKADPGLSSEKIGKAVGASGDTVSKWLIAAGLHISNPRFKPLAKAEAIAMKKADPTLSSRVIGEAVGASESAVSYWLRRVGLSTPQSHPESVKLKAMAMKKADPSLSCEAIGESLGVIAGTIHNWLKKAGLNTPAKITPEHVKLKAIAMKKANPSLPSRVIGENLDLSGPTVDTFLRRAGLNNSGEIPEHVKLKAIAMKKANPRLSNRMIGRAAGVSGPTVGKWLKEANL